MQVLLDSNILIRWLEPDNPDQIVVKAALDRLMLSNTDLCYTSQNLGEFWNAMTRPANRNGYGLSPDEADLRAREVEAWFDLLPDSVAVYNEWRRLLVDYRVSGVQVHDARLVAAMHVHGVKRILTFNTKNFARYDQIEAVHPLQMV
ncbi:MAG: type II toxin-antitoxin system VapC family toxin [Terracidiphilus sp.]|jgi:predicted nucleic acid-binding protein